MDKWRRLINGSIRVYMESVEKWPLGQKFLLQQRAPFDEPELDPDLALNAINGHLDGDRLSVMWIVAEAAATVLNRSMQPELRGVPEAIAIATQHIFNELVKVAADPLRWVYFSFPWGEEGSELATSPKPQPS